MTTRIAIGVLLTVLGVADARAQNQCPPPPNPSGCSLEFPITTIREADGDGDGFPDVIASAGSYCGGNAPAECNGAGPTAEVGLDLIVTDPSRQTVTCTLSFDSQTMPNPDNDVWFMTPTCNACIATGVGTAVLPAGTSTATQYKVVTADTNQSICPCGVTLECSFDIEVLCADGVDGDGDGLIDGDDPDCCIDGDNDGWCIDDCDDQNQLVHEPPGAIADLALAAAPEGTTLSWTRPFGEWGDVVSGSLFDARGAAGYSTATCLLEDTLEEAAVDPRPDPVPGDAYYYLARAQNSCGADDYGTAESDPPARSALDPLAPCSFDPACSGCDMCDPVNPPPLCGDRQCVVTFGTPATYCSGPVGTTPDGSVCVTNNDCMAGSGCFDWGENRFCIGYCRIGFSDCHPSATCAPFSPPVFVNGTEYGGCIVF